MIAIASDHAAVNFKSLIIKHLTDKGIKCIDMGADASVKASDYPDYAEKVCKAIKDGTATTGILVCGTGIGMSIAANKHIGIRCALCSDTFSAKATREHNDTNVLALGERVIGVGLALDIVDTFIGTQFTGEERHVRRIDKINKIESASLKGGK